MTSQPSLIEGSISRTLLQFSLPILYAGVLQSLNASVNSIWVGKLLGEAALAATSNANMVMFLLIGVAFGVAMASTIIIAQHVGAKDTAAAKRVVGTSATFFTVISFVIAAGGLLACEPLLSTLKTPGDSLPQAVAYMRVIFLAVPWIYIYAFVMSVLRGAGDSRTPFYFSLLSVGIDIALNPLLIFGVGPLPRLGIAGSALATVIAQAIALAALLYYLYRRRNPLTLHKGEFGLLQVDWSIVGRLVRMGVPMSAQMFVLSFSGVVMIALVNRFGVDTTAGFGASLQLWNYTQMPAISLSMAISAMAAQNVGAQRWDRVASIARIGVLYAILSTAFVVALTEVFSAHIYGLFLPVGSAAVRIGEHMNTIAGISFVLFGIALVLFGVVRATGAVNMPLAILVVALFGVRFPFAEALLDKWHADAIWWSFTISSAVAAVLAGAYYKYGKWREAHRSQVAAAAATPSEF